MLKSLDEVKPKIPKDLVDRARKMEPEVVASLMEELLAYRAKYGTKIIPGRTFIRDGIMYVIFKENCNLHIEWEGDWYPAIQYTHISGASGDGKIYTCSKPEWELKFKPVVE